MKNDVAVCSLLLSLTLTACADPLLESGLLGPVTVAHPL